MSKRTAAKKENSISKDKPEEAFGDVSKLGEDESDLSDSEESEYEGLEEEPSTSENEQESNDEEDESDSEDELTVSQTTKVNKEENRETEDIKNEDGIPEEIDEDEKLRRLAKQIKPIQFEDADTSDEEDIRNTVGNIPMEWYNDFQHYGYSLDGKKLIKKVQGDKLDDFLKKMDDPDYWKTVYDKTNMEEIKLTDEEISIIQRIEGGQFPHQEYNPYEPYVDWFTGDKMIHPIKDNPESKRSFVPSKWEHKKIMKIVRAIRNGWLRPKKGPEDDKPKYYLLWGKDDVGKSHPMQWPAPKLKLPGHEESYNPPPEYLPTEEEKKLWEEQDPEERSTNFLPQRYDSLRKVPGYKNFINERFDRCLDLYLCARQRKQRINVDADDLIPELPRPRDLQPFPTVQSLVYKGHKGVVTSISCDPTGQWLVSGSLDNTIRLWEVTTCRCMQIIRVKGEVHNVQWNPQQNLPLFAAAVDNSLMFINPNLGDKLICKNVDKVIQDFVKEEVASQGEATWEEATANEKEMGIRLKVVHTKPIKQITWHKKGDYLATVSPEGVSKSIHIHQLSKRKSQCPFSKAKGLVQCVRFHPTRPFFFVATQRYVRVYNLQKQELSKKLMAGVKWISSIDIHPQGDNLIIGSYDKRTCWFDMDLSTKPYKILRHHKQAVRQVIYHNCYPLFASASDDGSVVVSHATVYNDLMQNPMIVPLKFLYGHSVVDGLGVVDLTFHPHQPWLFTCGADTTIRLFT